MKSFKIILISLLLLFHQAAAAAETLTVAVAANVKYAFDDLAAAFGEETGIELKPVYGSSGKIVAQVKQGAPYDVFLSADMDYPQKLYADGQAVTAPKAYAFGKLVLLARRDGPDIGKGLASLAGPEFKKVALANPALAPYGAEAVKAMDKLGLKTAIEPKLVYAENIAQVMQYVDSGNVDAGITAKSLATAPEAAGRGKWVDLPADAYDPIAQGAVILRYGKVNHGVVARKFYNFLYSAKARAILEQFHYGLP